jgi:hypothetical protein
MAYKTPGLVAPRFGHRSSDLPSAISVPAQATGILVSGGRVMKLIDFPIAAVNWASIGPVVQAGETGTATTRTRNLGEVQLRLIDYSSGYKADHWCSKGHILHVIAGNLLIEYEDNGATSLTAGMTWHAADGALPAHRVICGSGASVLIVD